MTEGDARSGQMAADLCPEDGRALLRAWLDAVDLRLSERDLLALLQSDGFSHAALERRARRCHERGLERAVARAIAAPGELDAAAEDVFTACVAAIPYAPAAAFLGREKSKLARRDGEPLRVALVADGIGSMHGVTHTLDEIRERGVPGFEVEVIGTDPHVDRRLSAVAEVDVPFYAGMRVGVPSLPAVVEALSEGRYDVLHVCAPGPAGVASALIGRVLGLPIAGSYHTELSAYTALRSGDAKLGFAMEAALERLLRRLRRRVVAVAGERRAARLDGRGGGRALGPRRGRRALLPGAAHAGGGRPRPGAVRGAADEGEGRRPVGGRVPRGPRP